MEKEEQYKQVAEMLQEQKEKVEKIEQKIDYIDLENIKIVKANVGEQTSAVKSMLDSRPSFGVVCSQSGYKASLASLQYKDIYAITNSNLTNYETKKEIYKTIYNKIINFSAADWHPAFDEWLKMTSFGDYQTLLYGIYCSTFQDKSSVKFKCPYCQEESTIEIDNKKIIRVNDKKEMAEATDKISRESTSIDKIKEFSLVFRKKENFKTIKLPESKLILSLKLPTLYDVLQFLQEFKEEQIAALSEDVISLYLTLDKILILNTDKSTYSEIENNGDKLALLERLSIDDFVVAKTVSTKMIDDKHIDYIVEDQECALCKKKIPQIPMDIESLLFFQISEKQL